VSVLVVDASVAAKWLLPSQGEPLADEAKDLLARYVHAEVRFLVPDLFWAECGNVLCKAARQGRMTRRVAEKAESDLKRLNLPTISSRDLLDLALALALTFERTLYDALYIALAVDSKGEFVTADERLANAVASRLPVKWLGAI
jgi:predicted nucleic acid-binding protein